MQRELDPNRKDEELYGNNAAFTCPKCGRVFIVSASTFFVNVRNAFSHVMPVLGRGIALWRSQT